MKQPNNIYEYIKDISKRPQMYIGTLSLEKLECHLYGYLSALFNYNIIEKDVPDFRHFYEWVTWHKNLTCSIGGTRQIREKCKNDEDSFELFFKLIDEFSKQTESVLKEFDFRKVTKRSEKYCELNSGLKNEQIPSLIQIINLQPSNCCFIRSKYNNKYLNSRSLYPDVDSATISVGWEYGIELKLDNKRLERDENTIA